MPARRRRRRSSSYVTVGLRHVFDTPHDVRHCDAMLCVVSVVRQA